jgi:putative ATP-dependent endonuclease of OLD family
VRLQRFRGFEAAEILVSGHVAVVGEPRAGRTDLTEALRRVLYDRSTSSRVDPLDIYRPPPAADPPPLTEVEVTLVDLGDPLEQLLDPRLEAIDPATGMPAEPASAADAVLGVRLCYRARYDDQTGIGEHWVDYPKASNPLAGQFARAPRTEREALPVVSVDRSMPLQLRAEGFFRALISESTPTEFETALELLRGQVSAATAALSASTPVRQQAAALMHQGAAQILEVQGAHPENAISFAAEDGSTASLLRAIQPALELDAAGPLPLSSHGSTATDVLSLSEAALSASAPQSILIVDDFGDRLDAASAEYMAAKLRRDAGQVWLSTRRPEAVRAFRPEEILRLTRSHGTRQHHQLPVTTDRKERAVRRHLQLLLLPAMSARAVALLEGVHDLEGYSAVADRQLRVAGQPPPAAFGVRLVAAAGGEGGKDMLPRLARLAAALGFRIRAVLDNDGPGTDVALLSELQATAEVVIRLPNRTAVERALIAGLPASVVRANLTWLNDEYELNLDLPALSDADLPKEAARALKAKSGLHQPWVDALPSGQAPPLAVGVLAALRAAAPPVPLVEIPDA